MKGGARPGAGRPRNEDYASSEYFEEGDLPTPERDVTVRGTAHVNTQEQWLWVSKLETAAAHLGLSVVTAHHNPGGQRQYSWRHNQVDGDLVAVKIFENPDATLAQLAEILFRGEPKYKTMNLSNSRMRYIEHWSDADQKHAYNKTKNWISRLCREGVVSREQHEKTGERYLFVHKLPAWYKVG